MLHELSCFDTDVKDHCGSEAFNITAGLWISTVVFGHFVVVE